LVTEQVGKKWSKEMEVSVQAKTVELTEHWLAVGKELKLLQGENKARD
jgi:predicted YcjX-like family ATPase